VWGGHWCQLKEIIGAESLILSSQSQFWQGLERTRLVAKILKLTRMWGVWGREFSIQCEFWLGMSA
jgi:hypothetical protein